MRIVSLSVLSGNGDVFSIDDMIADEDSTVVVSSYGSTFTIRCNDVELYVLVENIPLVVPGWVSENMWKLSVPGAGSAVPLPDDVCSVEECIYRHVFFKIQNRKVPQAVVDSIEQFLGTMQDVEDLLLDEYKEILNGKFINYEGYAVNSASVFGVLSVVQQHAILHKQNEQRKARDTKVQVRALLEEVQAFNAK